METDLIKKIEKIKMVVFDVDGVLTDGQLIIGPRGEEYKSFNTQDGLGLKKAVSEGLIVAVISGRQSKAALWRGMELGIEEVHQGIKDKAKCLENLFERYNISSTEVAYLGDDLNDLPALNMVGLPCSVPKGVEEVKKISLIITNAQGGQGAVREIIELILKTQGKWKL